MEEVKRGRGRPPKNRDEEGLDLDNTNIEGEGGQQKKAGRPKASTVQKEIVADKLNIFGDGLFSLLGYEYTFTAEDYKKEALALTNLAKQYNFLGKMLEMLDPLLIVFGLWQKAKTLKKRPKAHGTPKTEQQQTQNVPNENQNPSSVSILPFAQRR